MRETLVTELVRDVLGPRSGKSQDLMDGDPYDEFITGVLVPSHEGAADDELPPYRDPAPVETSDDEAGMQDDGRDAEPLDAVSSPLDPKKRPTSMGITFMVKTPGAINLKVCITWARYVVDQSEDGKKWIRLPRWTVDDLELDPASAGQTKPVDEFEGQEQDGAELALETTIRKWKDGHYLVSAFLKNSLSTAGRGKLYRSCVFQPQLRINSSGDTEMSPLPASVTKYGNDDEMLDHLYRDEQVLARGHLVSAVWRKIDPEGAGLQNSDSGPPFGWADGDAIPDSTRREFSPPEIRTEYVPIYQIPLPDLDWDGSLVTSPALSAEKLSEAWNPEKLRSMLYPIYEEYSGWIDRMEAGGTDARAVRECRNAARRIKDGLDILTDPAHDRYDEDLVLSFCFANKAMLLSAQWSDRQDFVYRPFQLAFLLMCMESAVNPESEHRGVCDLMWVPTGTGKTEAYLALAALVFAYRRRTAVRSGSDHGGAGVSVLTRYTLRLLTTQQFRRTLAVVTAAESLRTEERGGMPHGWRPEGHPEKSPLIWGSAQFSIGLWIGTSMTPNWFGKKPHDDGAEALLARPAHAQSDMEKAPDPAQVLNCPACGGTLAVPEQGLEAGKPHVLHFVVKAGPDQNIEEAASKFASKRGSPRIRVLGCEAHAEPGFLTVSLELLHDARVTLPDIVHMWGSFEKEVPATGCAASPARPGYFFTSVQGPRKQRRFDFEIFCANPACPLRHKWCGGAPNGRVLGGGTGRQERSAGGLQLPDGNAFMHVLEPFRAQSPFLSDRTPIPALTCDYQVYARAPTVVIATSDKLARPPFEPLSASVFGNVDRHHEYKGYYRDGVADIEGGLEVGPLRRPDLIIQDELHLADGPLGSMMGMYESAVDMLCSGSRPVKYVASTATIRNATDHVKSLFGRGLQIFPPHGSGIHDRFFVRSRKESVTDYSARGRMYVGICAFGRGPLTPQIRICSRLFQSVWDHRKSPGVDPYWTMVRYFGAIRDLAEAISMHSQDVPNRMRTLSDSPRALSPDPSELSGRISSMKLHGILELLEKKYDAENPEASPDSLFTTSMFGTGIDIPRLGLMYVHGQPKTVSSYIQATGRVGRQNGGLVVTFCKAARARDLSHYEFFSRYHSQLHRFVEAPTVYPFSQALVDKALGPVIVFILRNMRDAAVNWGSPDSAAKMADEHRGKDAERAADSIVGRILAQQDSKWPCQERSMIRKLVERCLLQWAETASACGSAEKLAYNQYRVSAANLSPVVLGDSIHEHAGVKTAYAGAPQSLREVEEETTFGDQ